MARLLEMDYLGRFDTSVYEAGDIYTPAGNVEVSPEYWDGRGRRLHERPRLERLLDEAERADSYPLNRRSRYTVGETGLFGLSQDTHMIIEAAVHSNLEAHAKNGFDANPATIDDLLFIANTAVAEAEARDQHRLLAIASPTGWTDRVRERVEDDDVARTHLSRQLSLVLVDLSTGRLVYDDADEVVTRNLDLFELLVPEERVKQCVTEIRSNYMTEAGVDSVLLEELVSEDGFDVHVADEAFDRLTEAGEAERLHLDEYGDALDFSSTI